MRLRSDIWVSAYIRRCASEGAYAVLRRRGAAEAGAIFVRIDWPDRNCQLFGPAPQSELRNDGIDRQWTRLHEAEFVSGLDTEDRLQRELKFDPDIWIVEVENSQGRNFLDLA